VDLARRASDLVPYVWEAIGFGTREHLVRLSGDWLIPVTNEELPKPEWPAASEPADCIKAACFVGRWFARAGDETTIFAMLGVIP